MADPLEPDTQPDEARSADPSMREAEELDLARVAEEWRRETREAEKQREHEAEDQRTREAEERQESTAKAKKEVKQSARGCLWDGLDCCAYWSLITVACAGLVLVVAAWARRARA